LFNLYSIGTIDLPRLLNQHKYVDIPLLHVHTSKILMI